MNIQQAIPFNKNILSTAVCMGLVAMSPNVQAVTLNANTSATSGTSTDMQADTQTNYVNVYSSAFDTAGSGGYSTAAGNDSGWMYSSAGGSNTFLSTSNIQQVVNFTNTSAFAQSYAFDFTINFGSLTASNYAPTGLGEFVTASNKVSIKLNGVEIFNSEATLTTDDTGTSSLTTVGTVLGTYSAGSDYYSWSPFSDTLDLGVFGVGESFTLEYDIFTFANSNGSPNASCGGYGFYGDYGYGVDIIAFGGEGFCDRTSAYAQFGDPNGLSSTPINSSTVTSQPASVPEESSFLLFGAGLAGLAFSRRRRSRKN